MAKNITIETNSNLFALVNVDMYVGTLSPPNIIDVSNEFENISLDENEFWDKYSFDKYKKQIEVLAAEFFNRSFTYNDFEIKISTKQINSPLFYNYSIDTIDFDCTFNYKQLLNHIEANIDEFNLYLENNYTPSNGYVVFVPNTFNGWLPKYKEKDVRCLSIALDFIFDDDFKNELNDSFEEYVRFNLDYSKIID